MPMDFVRCVADLVKLQRHFPRIHAQNERFPSAYSTVRTRPLENSSIGLKYLENDQIPSFG